MQKKQYFCRGKVCNIKKAIMSEAGTYYCRKCGAKLMLTPEAVLKHYEKAHFSDWAANKELMARMPKAFVVDTTQ